MIALRYTSSSILWKYILSSINGAVTKINCVIYHKENDNKFSQIEIDNILWWQNCENCHQILLIKIESFLTSWKLKNTIVSWNWNCRIFRKQQKLKWYIGGYEILLKQCLEDNL